MSFRSVIVRSVEDLTLRELAERVERANRLEDETVDRTLAQLVRRTSDQISALVGLPDRERYHSFAPYGNASVKSCVKCPYPQEHMIHSSR